MNKRIVLPMLLVALLLSVIADAQYGRRPMYRHYRQRPYEDRDRPQLPSFKPSVNVSIGYGFPNVDESYLPDYYNTLRGGTSQWGPVTAAVDYQFNRRMSIGVLVTHGSVSAPYYNRVYSSSFPDFTAKFDNWSFMLDIVKYVPVSAKIIPYTRIAIGVNSWKQSYTDIHGNAVPVEDADLPDLAYQAAIGVKFKMAKNAGFFAEAGYGKYILHGGLSLKF
jgi:hypothetical protein